MNSALKLRDFFVGKLFFVFDGRCFKLLGLKHLPRESYRQNRFEHIPIAVRVEA